MCRIRWDDKGCALEAARRLSPRCEDDVDPAGVRNRRQRDGWSYGKRHGSGARWLLPLLGARAARIRRRDNGAVGLLRRATRHARLRAQLPAGALRRQRADLSR